MPRRISSPGDSYYQGKGSSGVTNTDLGKTKTTGAQDKIIESLMLPRLQVKKNTKNIDAFRSKTTESGSVNDNIA